MGGEFESKKELEDFVNSHRPLNTPEIYYEEVGLLDHLREQEKKKGKDISVPRTLNMQAVIKEATENVKSLERKM